jgi:hypothetical protein
MNKIGFYTNNIASAALSGCLIGILFFMIVGSGWNENAIRYGTYGLTVLVSLFASSVAIGSALLSLDKQTELVNRKHVAARAILPLTLANLYKTSEKGFEISLNVIKLREQEINTRTTEIDTLRIPADDIKQIRDCVEASDPKTQEWLALIIAHWQIEISRLEDRLFENDLIIIDGQPETAGVNWLTIRSMIIHLFGYARTGNAPSPILDPDKIVAPIMSKHLHSLNLARAREEKIAYVNENGGWDIKGFKSRFER